MSDTISTIYGYDTSPVSILAGDVSIAGVRLTGLAVPESMNFGGAQRVMVHKLPGGARQIDAMGPDDAEIEFKGYFTGPFGCDIADELDTIRQAGAAVPLICGMTARMVVITDFTWRVTGGGWIIPYEVRCTVMQQTGGDYVPPLLQQCAQDTFYAGAVLGALSVLV